MIWGAAGGIGQALVSELSAGDWRVVAISRHDDSFEDDGVIGIYADVGEPFSVQRAIQEAASEVTEVDLWVYAAGDIVVSAVGELKPEVWNRLLSANLTGAYLATHYSLPLLAANAHMFYVGAISERLRLPGFSAYAAAKAGIEAFADTVRKEQRKLRITTVRPSAVATSFWAKVPVKMPPNAAQPSKIAREMLSAYENGQTGVLEIA